ncbi:hypothetical protein P168DRAFT_323925 [Aspergillus campestris IBT 28561]|uniref:Synaptobrevin n=1 Tax=Aspergillus campestris (strain IBT 28561) TaxID=1392248 RepID=A0A2I1DG75_ASPC2|nr:uncharacterized protein P168DRAFT_323925 [Aspergillus campestris IBT 28561]PKY08872.1 hypothetical protein P168DRAFT_323925 [Aspergillus campestris IBT 28561]
MTLTTYPVSAADSPDLTALSLSRLVHRLELNLLVPSADLSPLRQSEYQRMRVGANIAFAQSTLTSLERALPTIKAPDHRNDLQTDLLLYRQTLKKLQAVLDEITTEAETLRSARRGAAGQDEGDDESESESLDGEDLLTPDEGSSTSGDGGRGGLDEEGGVSSVTATTTTSAVPTATTQPPQATTTTQPTKQEQPEPALPTLRNRSHLPPSSSTTAPTTPTATTTGARTGTDLFPLPHAQTDPTPSSTSQTESQLTTDRTTQEDLTTSLLSLASQLKSSSHAFHASLESEKSVLARAVDGLDRSTGSMGAAERRMGTLRRMTEGKGWWGRMMLYAWIFGLWLLAVLIVFLGPKLRF